MSAKNMNHNDMRGHYQRFDSPPQTGVSTNPDAFDPSANRVEPRASVGSRGTAGAVTETINHSPTEEGKQNDSSIIAGEGPAEVTQAPQRLLSLDYEGNCLQEEMFLHVTRFFEYDADEDELDDELGFHDPAQPPVKGCNMRYLRWRTRRFVEHFGLRLLTALSIVVDMLVLVVDLFNNPTEANDPLEYCSLAFSVYFALEVLLRLFGLGWWTYFNKWYNSLDFVIVITTLALSVLMVVIEDMASTPANLLVILRLIRLLRITRILWERRQLQIGARHFISQNKRRYQRDGFDLDLTYVSPRIIAMSFPSSGKMSLYRNDIKEVARFLNTKHRGRYLVFNLCSERHYDTKRFNGHVRRFFISDHNVPTLQEMLEFSEIARTFMAEDEENVIAVHCKGGKGRTGTMICVILIDTGLFADAAQCLGFFGDRRTDKNAGKKFQGVETPSQCRYVEYYEMVVKAGRQVPPEKSLIITAFTIKGINNVGSGNGSDFSISVRSRCYVIAYEASLQLKFNCQATHHQERDELLIKLLNPPRVRGDTKVMFHSSSRKIPRGYENCPFYFWFNTGFIDGPTLELSRQELDNPHKQKTWSVFEENFRVIAHFIPNDC